MTIEQLKAEIEAVTNENQQLKEQIQGPASAVEKETQEQTAKPAVSEKTSERRVQANGNPAKYKRTPVFHEFQKPVAGSHSTRGKQNVKAPLPRNTTHNNYEDSSLFDLTPRESKVVVQAADSSTHDPSQQPKNVTGKTGKDLPTQPKAFPPLEDGETGDASKDLTYLSFINAREIASLRKTIEQERLDQKQRVTLPRQVSRSETVAQRDIPPESHLQTLENTLPSKSAMKSYDAASAHATQQAHVPPKGDGSEHIRRHSETSIVSTRSRRRCSNAENVTSAFILPDITIRKTADHLEKLDPSNIQADTLGGNQNHHAQS